MTCPVLDHGQLVKKLLENFRQHERLHSAAELDLLSLMSSCSVLIVFDNAVLQHSWGSASSTTIAERCLYVRAKSP